jgi:serine/threonine-protein kinase
VPAAAETEGVISGESLQLFASSRAQLPDVTNREAQTLASLNHPNIAQIYGLEEANGVRALVMELVEGEDVSQRIARGPIPIDEALPIAKQIADALEAAHEQGIVHRDLKPANIKVRPDGAVKVLDFGLAKALEPTRSATDMSNAPTITSTTIAETEPFSHHERMAYRPPRTRNPTTEPEPELEQLGRTRGGTCSGLP